jgi:hypothetical protein
MTSRKRFKKALARIIRMDRDLFLAPRYKPDTHARIVAAMAAIGKGRVMAGRKDEAIAAMNAARYARHQTSIPD